MSLNQRLTTEFSPCTPSAPQSRDLSIQTIRQLDLISLVGERICDHQGAGLPVALFN